MCPLEKRSIHWKWIKNMCRPSCEYAAFLAGYEGYGADEKPNVAYSKKTKSCKALKDSGHDDWKNFVFTDKDEEISNKEVWEVVKDGGVCCVRGEPFSSENMCPSDKPSPHWKWVENECRPSCRRAAMLAGYENSLNFIYSKKANSCEDLSDGGYSDWTDFDFVDGRKERSNDEVWQVVKEGGVCCIRDDPTEGLCPEDKRYPHWKWVKNLCRPSCGHATHRAGYTGEGADGKPNKTYSSTGSSCQDLVHKGHDDWENFSFMDGHREIMGNDAWEVAERGGVCCVRGAGITSPNLCPAEKQSLHWRWIKNACRPSCGYAALSAGYDGYGNDGNPNAVYVAIASSCADLIYLDLDDWKSFSFLDIDGQTRVLGNDAWQVAQSGGVCCVRGEPTLLMSTEFKEEDSFLNILLFK